MSEAIVMRLHAMRFLGRVGHTEAERDAGTHVEVDVELDLVLEQADMHELTRTIDYREVHDVVGAVVGSGDHPLLEGLARDILSALDKFTWERALVRVRKPSPPIRGQMAHAEVELRRERSDRSG